MSSSKNIRNILADNVKKYRKLNNYTQSELAEKTELSNTYIANIECGKTWISDTTLEKIANSLHTKTYLFFVDDDIEDSDYSAEEKKLEFIKSKKNELTTEIDTLFNKFISEYLDKFS